MSAREDGVRLSPPPAPGQWGRSSSCPGQRPTWEVHQQGPKAFPADLIEPQEPAPGGGVWGGAGRASSSSAHSWNAQVRADLPARVSSPLPHPLHPQGAPGRHCTTRSPCLGQAREEPQPAVEGVQAAESQAARSHLGQRPVPMTRSLAALITNRGPDRCWRPGLRVLA